MSYARCTLATLYRVTAMIYLFLTEQLNRVRLQLRFLGNLCGQRAVISIQQFKDSDSTNLDTSLRATFNVASSRRSQTGIDCTLQCKGSLF